MRIDLQNSYLSNLNDLQKPGAKAAESKEPGTIGGDVSADVQLSNVGQQAMAAPDIRQERVAELRQAIDSGTYSVSNEALADAMMRDLLQH